MEKELEIEQFLALRKSLPVIDVRSPAEFDNGHIPGAFNLPIFDNEERSLVGTLYKQKGREQAILAGLDIIGPKMSSLVTGSKKISKNNEVLIHCWRGGMRSASFAWLLNTAGINARTLIKGYKSYRNFVLSSFADPVNILVVGGETGSGKTDIIKKLHEKGEQVIDLEGLAHHKGSSFGSIGQLPQPQAEQFENDLAEEWRGLDPAKRVWLEDESKNIGKVFLPEELWSKMKLAPIIRLSVPKSERVKRLVREYGKADRTQLREAIERIEKRLGGLAFKQSLEALDKNDLAAVAEITLVYYDKAYNYNHEKRNFKDVFRIEVDADDPEVNAEMAIAFADEKFKNSSILSLTNG